MNNLPRWLISIFAFLVTIPAFAHRPSDSYLRLDLSGQSIRGEWQIALRDLDHVLSLDSNRDLAITWGELKEHQAQITDFALSNLSFAMEEKNVPLELADFLVDHHSDGGYAVLRFVCTGPISPGLQITYNFLFDIDAQHRGILFLGNGSGPTRIFKPDDRSFAFDPTQLGRPAPFAPLVVEGIWHIWKGFDHVLFLLTLLLPTVIRRERNGWVVAESFKSVLWSVAKVVTAFTLAHSITLAFAVLELVRLPAIYVESVIAISVVVAALNNLFPFLYRKTWAVAFGFGLIHGFGFANVFADLGISSIGILKALFAFNLGVELGQLALVFAFLPLAFLFRKSPHYRVLGVQGASAAVVLIATTWTAERLLNFKLLPF